MVLCLEIVRQFNLVDLVALFIAQTGDEIEQIGCV